MGKRRYVPPSGAPAFPEERALGDYRISFVDVDSLRPHERIRPKRVAKTLAKIIRRGFFHKPVLVDRRSGTILDGHHKWTAARALGLRRLPAVLVDYLRDERIILTAWEPDRTPRLRKADVVAHGRNGVPFPPKTSRHVLPAPLPRIRVPLGALL